MNMYLLLARFSRLAAPHLNGIIFPATVFASPTRLFVDWEADGGVGERSKGLVSVGSEVLEVATETPLKYDVQGDPSVGLDRD